MASMSISKTGAGAVLALLMLSPYAGAADGCSGSGQVWQGASASALAALERRVALGDLATRHGALLGDGLGALVARGRPLPGAADDDPEAGVLRVAGLMPLGAQESAAALR